MPLELDDVEWSVVVTALRDLEGTAEHELADLADDDDGLRSLWQRDLDTARSLLTRLDA